MSTKRLNTFPKETHLEPSFEPKESDPGPLLLTNYSGLGIACHGASSCVRFTHLPHWGLGADSVLPPFILHWIHVQGVIHAARSGIIWHDLIIYILSSPWLFSY